MAKVEVEVVRPFQRSSYGTRSAGEKFAYDLDGDPAGLKAGGFVKAVDAAVEAAAEPPAAKPKGRG